MGSRSQKIYLSLVLSLVFFTALASVWLPRFLEQSEGTSLKELEPAPKVSFSDGEFVPISTRFPTRAFPEASMGSDQGGEPSLQQNSAAGTSSGGMPSRDVPGVDQGAAVGDRVTTRAYLQSNSAVFSRPQTTAKVLGRVGQQTKVRWLAKMGDGWEEILLKDGRSAYVQSEALSFSANSDQTHRTGFDFNHQQDSGPDASILPGTVESFLRNLSENDLLRAETFLSPLASRLETGSLSGLSPYVGVPSLGRVLRIELVGAGRSNHRRTRIVYGPKMEHEVATIWEWDAGQRRWMLVRWD